MNDNMNEITIAWYSPEEYELFKEASIDPLHWHPFYEDWLEQVKHAESQLSLLGKPVLRVPMIHRKFIRWCKRNKAKNVSADRARYAAMLNL